MATHYIDGEWVDESEAVIPLVPNIISTEKPWHIHAVEILELLNPQFKINTGKETDLGKNDWFPDEQCFISVYGKTPIIVGFFCKIGEPTFGELERFAHLTYVLSLDPFVIGAANGEPTEALNARLAELADQAGLDAALIHRRQRR